MLHITEDLPRQSLRLEWKGLPKNFISNIVILLVSLPFALMFLWMICYFIYAVAIGKESPAALLVLLFILPFLAIIVGVHFAMDRHRRNLSWLSFHSGNASIRWRESAPLRAHDRVISFADLRELRFDISAERGNAEVPIQITMGHAKQGSGTGRFSHTVLVKSVNIRLEAMDLIFRFARVLGWDGYHVIRNDPRSLVIDLSKTASDSEQAIPVGAGRMNFDVDIRAAAFEEPEMQLKPFQPANIEGSFDRKPVIEWQPGTLVRVQVPGAKLVDLLPKIIPATFLTAFAAYIGCDFFWNTPFKIPVAILAGAAAFAVATKINKHANREKEFVVDWNRREAMFRQGSNIRKFPLTDIEEVVLHGRKRYVKHKNSPGYTLYWCDFIAVLPGPDAPILTCATVRDNADRPMKLMLPMAVELARALNIRWRWNEY